MSVIAEQAGLWTCCRIQARVIGACFSGRWGRRFGRDNLGYLWLFAEPLMLGGAIGALHYISEQRDARRPGADAFLDYGLYTVLPLARHLQPRPLIVIAGNQSLLYHRRVTLHDIIMARNLLELAAVCVVMAGFMLGFMAVAEFRPAHFEYVMLSFALRGCCRMAFVLLIAIGSVYTELFERFTHLFTYLSLPVTGAFFMVFWLPSRELQEAALLVPTVNLFEMMRYGLYGTLVPTEFDIGYVLAWCAVTNLIGIAGLRRARRRLVV